MMNNQTQPVLCHMHGLQDSFLKLFTALKL